MRRFGVALTLAALFFAVFGSRAWAVDDQDCSDFPSQAAAQAHLRADPTDPDKLDPDGDGIACEANPGPFDTVPVNSASVVRSQVSTTTTRVVQSSTTTAVSSSDLASSGPHPYTWAVAAAGVVIVLAGISMRGRRAAGSHW